MAEILNIPTATSVVPPALTGLAAVAKVDELPTVANTTIVMQPPINTNTFIMPPVMPRPNVFWQPAHWQLVTVEGDMIEGVNSVTGDKFEGTVADFNDMLRGR